MTRSFLVLGSLVIAAGCGSTSEPDAATDSPVDVSADQNTDVTNNIPDATADRSATWSALVVPA